MAKIRIDLPPDPYDWFFLCMAHEPLWWDLPLGHYIFITDLDHPEIYGGATLWYGDLPQCQSMARYLLQRPDIISDFCRECHFFTRFTNVYPRMGLEVLDRYPYKRPAFRFPWTRYDF